MKRQSLWRQNVIADIRRRTNGRVLRTTVEVRVVVTDEQLVALADELNLPSCPTVADVAAWVSTCFAELAAKRGVCRG